MRNAFADEITKTACRDARVLLLAGDIGNRLFNDFKAAAPERFFNCGVAEANMMGMAAGLAMCGFRPFVYTIAPFATLRCLEQIRVDACYHDLPVTVVGAGAGLSYANLGPTHHCCEDIALLRVIPNMTVVCPGDAVEVRLAVAAAAEWSSPVYIRLGKKDEPVVHSAPPAFEIGRAIVVRAGNDVCLLSTGNILSVATRAADLLSEHGTAAQVVSMHTVKPLDTALLKDVFQRFPLVVTLEEHSKLGGLGGAVAEWYAANQPLAGRLLSLGTADVFLHNSGSQEYARTISGLSPTQAAQCISDSLRGVTGGCG